MAGDVQELKGTVDRIVYENGTTGFFVFVVSDKQNSVVVRGTVPALRVGQEVILQGMWAQHPRFGKQFEVCQCSIAHPTSRAGLKKYLSSGVIRGVGATYAQKLVDAFGENVLDVIDTHPERLCAVEGIGPKRLEQIIAGWQEQKNVAHVMVFLQDKGISLAYATKIYKRYGQDAVKVITENPYRLAGEIWGIGFKIADQIARNLGFAHNCVPRIKAGLLFCIQQAAGNGHLYVERDSLKKDATVLLELSAGDDELIKQAFTELFDSEKIKIVTYNDMHYIATAQQYASEYGVAQKLKQILAYTGSVAIDVNAVYQMLRMQTGNVQLNDDQVRGVLAALQHKVTVITGGPGTGKTTLIKQLLEVLDEHRVRYKLAAPTGRAAKRMAESTGRSSATIHRLLEFDPAHMQFKHNEFNTISTDVIIVDEASMIDIFLAYAFLKATALATHLIFIGDIDQLPPVGAGNFLQDIIASGVVPCVRLTHIFRQAQYSLITINAHRVNHGEFPTTSLPVPKKDFVWIKEEYPERVHELIRSLYTTRLKSYGIDASRTMVLVPMNRGIVGTHKLNQELQLILNPLPKDKVAVGLVEFKVDDRVMQIRNNYEKMVFNGDIGFVRHINNADREVCIVFGEREVVYRYEELDELVLAYAVSIHKSQGSEYDAVIIPIFTQHFMLLARNLVYTAITRAKKLCILIGQTRALAIAIKNNKSVKRQTFLMQYLTSDLSCRQER